MSESELSEALSFRAPTDAALERSLRDEVAKKFETGERDQVTVNGIRGLSEKALGLDAGFYNAHEQWKGESKRIIKEEVNRQDTLSTSPVKSQSTPRPAKRPSPEPKQKPRKKQKVESPPAEDADELSAPPIDLRESSSEARAEKKAAKGAKEEVSKSKARDNGVTAKATKKSVESAKEAGSRSGRAGKDVNSPAREQEISPEKPAMPVEDSESELSSLIDDDEPSKKRRKSKESSEKRPTKTSKAKLAAKTDEDPDTAEIKRLQGWLVKCGIRKLWGKELKPYERPKDKVRHLRDMLTQAGMTGRYSQEKAAQIKEARELAADIEAVQEGAERWGKEGSGEGSSDDGAPKRRLVRGAKNYDFLSSDGEETD